MGPKLSGCCVWMVSCYESVDLEMLRRHAVFIKKHETVDFAICLNDLKRKSNRCKIKRMLRLNGFMLWIWWFRNVTQACSFYEKHDLLVSQYVLMIWAEKAIGIKLRGCSVWIVSWYESDDLEMLRRHAVSIT